MHTKLFSIVLACVLVISSMYTASGETAITSDRKIDGLQCHDHQLGTVLMTVLRAAGKQPILDPALDGDTLTGDFDGLTITQIITKLEKEKHLQFETVTGNTVYVTRAEPVPDATAIAMANGPVPPPTKAPTLDEVLNMPTGSQTPPVEQIPPQAVAPRPKPIVLKAGLEHKARMTPVDHTLRAGAKVDLGKLRALTPGNQWARIPHWAGGSWKTLTMTAFYHYHYVHQTKNFHVDTFMDKASETLGWQADAKGDLWHFLNTDFYTIAEGEKDYSIDFHKYHEVLNQTDDEFVVHHVAVRALVDKVDKKVIRVFQAESINLYTQGKNGTLRCKSSIKEFDDDGNPVSLQKGISYAQRIRPFHCWNVYKKMDMPKLFAEYLDTHGMSELAPKTISTKR